jgi:putative endonuclease
LSKNLGNSLQDNTGKQEKYWLYILSNSKPNGPLYLGDTDCLYVRMNEHLAGLRRDYAHYHRLDRLVYFEMWTDHDKFVARLRRVRNWPRDMRLLLIESLNPDWNDLLPQFFEERGNRNQQEQKQEKAA